MKPPVARFYWSHLTGAKHVLDLGCASGELGRYKPSGTLVRGLELDPALVAQALAYEDARQWDLDNPVPLPFHDECIDAIVAKDILENLQ